MVLPLLHLVPCGLPAGTRVRALDFSRLREHAHESQLAGLFINLNEDEVSEGEGSEGERWVVDVDDLLILHVFDPADPTSYIIDIQGVLALAREALVQEHISGGDPVLRNCEFAHLAVALMNANRRCPDALGQAPRGSAADEEWTSVDVGDLCAALQVCFIPKDARTRQAVKEFVPRVIDPPRASPAPLRDEDALDVERVRLLHGVRGEDRGTLYPPCIKPSALRPRHIHRHVTRAGE